MGAMSGGEKFLTYCVEAQRALGSATEVHIGFLENATAGYNGPRPRKGAMKRTSKAPTAISAVPAAYVAAIQEYGDPSHNIPARPFFSTMIEKQSPTWGQLLAIALERNNYYARPALTLVGLKIQEQLKKSIVEFDNPPNAAATIAKKGFDNPLIDSHNMLNSVDFVVL
jgi:hypothetical protein